MENKKPLTDEEFEAVLRESEKRFFTFNRCKPVLVFPINGWDMHRRVPETDVNASYTLGLEKRLIREHRANMKFEHPYAFDNTLMKIEELFPVYDDHEALAEHVAAWAAKGIQDEKDERNTERVEKLKKGDVILWASMSSVGTVVKKVEVPEEEKRWKGDKMKAYLIEFTMGEVTGERRLFANQITFIK